MNVKGIIGFIEQKKKKSSQWLLWCTKHSMQSSKDWMESRRSLVWHQDAGKQYTFGDHIRLTAIPYTHSVITYQPCGLDRKSTCKRKCFFQWSAPRRMKNEAGLPPMKRASGTRREKCALRFTRAKLHSNSWVLNGSKVAASYLRSNASFQTQVLFSYARKQPITYNALHWFNVG